MEIPEVTGAVVIDGRVVYSRFNRRGGEIRVRVGIGEALRLGLTPGKWAVVELPGDAPEKVLLDDTSDSPPWTCLLFAARSER